MKHLTLLAMFLVSCGREPVVEITEGSPQEAVIKYHDAARAGAVEEANSYVSSYDHKKFERFPENRTVAIEYYQKHAIKPRIDGVQTRGRLSAVSIVYKDPQSQRGEDRIEYILLIQEGGGWKLVRTSRPYVGSDAGEWAISAEEMQAIRDLEMWYEGRKKQFNHG